MTVPCARKEGLVEETTPEIRRMALERLCLSVKFSQGALQPAMRPMPTSTSSGVYSEVYYPVRWHYKQEEYSLRHLRLKLQPLWSCRSHVGSKFGPLGLCSHYNDNCEL
eukprot:6449707-Amphidinium_carterae.2